MRSIDTLLKKCITLLMSPILKTLYPACFCFSYLVQSSNNVDSYLTCKHLFLSSNNADNYLTCKHWNVQIAISFVSDYNLLTSECSQSTPIILNYSCLLEYRVRELVPLYSKILGSTGYKSHRILMDV